MFGMTADEFLTVLEKMDEADNPFVDAGYEPEVVAAYIEYSHAVAKFVRTWTDAFGYEVAVQMVEVLTHALPSPDIEDAFLAAAAAILDDFERDNKE